MHTDLMSLEINGPPLGVTSMFVRRVNEDEHGSDP